MSDLVISGVIHEIKDLETGPKKDGSGDWSKLTFVVEVDAGNGYKDYVPFTMFKTESIDKFLQYNQVGDNVEVSFNLKGRAWQDKWFLDAIAWRVWKENQNAAPGSAVARAAAATAAAGSPDLSDLSEEEYDDLPF